MRSTLVVVLPIIALSFGLAPVMHAQSAKALYGNPTDNSTVVTSGQEATHSGTRSVQRSTHAAAQNQVVATGAKYWIQLRKADGTIERVTAEREFHSGERIRLHLTSNVSGHLVIMQKENSGPYELLYPTRPGGKNQVLKGHEEVFPSDGTWFRFDNNPGQVKLLVMITPESQSNGPQAPPAQPDLRDASDTEEVASAMVKRSEDLAGGKGLVQETAEGEDLATYVVLNPTQEAPAAPVAFEIAIRHRP